jgi:hypothetical protein
MSPARRAEPPPVRLPPDLVGPVDLELAKASQTDQSSSPEPSRTLNRPTMTPGCHTFESIF